MPNTNSSASLSLILQLEDSAAKANLGAFSTLVLNLGVDVQTTSQKMSQSLNRAGQDGADAARILQANWERSLTSTGMKVDALLDQTKQLGKANPKLNTADLEQQLTGLAAKLRQLSEQPVTLTARADFAEVNAQISSLQRTIQQTSRTANSEGATGMQAWGQAALGLYGQLALVQQGLQYVEQALDATMGAAIRYNDALVMMENNSGMMSADTKAAGDTIMTVWEDSRAKLQPLIDAYDKLADYNYRGADAQKVLETAMKSAVSTGGDLEATTALLVETNHVYGNDISQLTAQMDTLHTAQLRSAADFEDFAANSSRAIALGAQFKIPLNEVASALSALSKAGYSASEAQTQVVNILTHVANPSKQARDELQKLADATGMQGLVKDFSAAGLASRGLSGIMDDLTAAYKLQGLSEEEVTGETMKLLNAQRGGLGMAALLTSANQDYKDTLDAVAEASKGVSATELASARSMQTTQGQLDSLGNKWQALLTKIGERPGGQRDEAAGWNVILAGMDGFISKDGNLWDKIAALEKASGDTRTRYFQEQATIMLAEQQAANQNKLNAQDQADARELANQKRHSDELLNQQRQTQAESDSIGADLASHAQGERADDPATGAWTQMLNGAVTSQVTQFKTQFLQQFNSLPTDVLDKIKVALDNGDLQAIAKLSGKDIGSASVNALINSLTADLQAKFGPEAAKAFQAAMAQIAPNVSLPQLDASNIITDFNNQLLSSIQSTDPARYAAIKGMLDNGNITGALQSAAQVLGVDSVFTLANSMINQASQLSPAVQDALADPLSQFYSTATQMGAQTGTDYARFVMGNIATETPNINGVLQYMAKHMDVYGSQVTAIAGKHVGEVFAANAQAGITLAEANLADALDSMARELSFTMTGDDTAADRKTAAQLGNMQRRASALREMAKERIDVEVPQWDNLGLFPDDPDGLKKKGPKGPDLAAQARSAENAAETVINALQKAGQTSTTEGKTLAEALSPLAQLVETKLPAGFEFVLGDYNKLLAGFKSGALTMGDVTNTVRGDLETIAASGDIVKSSEAQEALDTWGQQTTQAAKQAADAISSARQSALKDMDSLGQDLADPKRNPGKIMQDALDLADQASKAGWPDIAATARQWTSQIASGADTDFGAMSASMNNWLDQMLSSGDEKLVALAMQFKANNQQILADQAATLSQSRQDAVSALDQLRQDASDPNRNVGKIMLDMISLGEAANKAGLTNIVADTQRYTELMASGAQVNWSQMIQDYGVDLDSMKSIADPKLQGLITQEQQTWTEQEQNLKAHNLQMQSSYAGSFDALMGDYTAAKHDIPQTIIDMYAAADAAQAAGQDDQAKTLRQNADVLRQNGVSAWDWVEAKTFQILKSNEANVDSVTWATYQKALANFNSGDAALKAAMQQSSLDDMQKLFDMSQATLNPKTNTGDDLLQANQLAKQLQDQGHGDWAQTILQDAKDVEAGVPGAFQKMSSDSLAILRLLDDGSVAEVHAMRLKLEQEAKDAGLAAGQAAIAASQAVSASIGAIQNNLAGKDGQSPDTLVAIFDTIDKLNAAGDAFDANRLLADAQAIEQGVSGSWEKLAQDLDTIQTNININSDAKSEALRQQQVAKAQQTAQQVADAYKQAQQSLSSGLGTLGKDLLDPTKSWLSDFAELGALAKQAADAGMPDVANEIQSILASGGEGGGQALFDNVMRWLQELAQSADPVTRAMAQDMEQQLQMAEVLRADQDAVDEWGRRVAAQQDVVQGFSDRVNQANSDLQKFTQTKLLGEGAFDDKEFANQQQQNVLKLQIAQLQEQGPATGGQVAYLQQQLALLEKQGEILNLQQHVQYDPEHRAIDKAANPDQEMDPDDALKGAKQARAELDKYQPMLDSAQKNLKAMSDQQKLAQKALDADTLSMQQQTTALAALGTQYTTALGQIATAMQGSGSQFDLGLQGIKTSFNNLFGTDVKQQGSLLFAMFDHSQGFFNQMDTRTNQSLTWSRYEIWDANMISIKSDMMGILEKMGTEGAPVAKSAAVTQANAYAQGWRDNKQMIQDAIRDATQMPAGSTTGPSATSVLEYARGKGYAI